MVAAVEKAHGPIDTIVANAGIAHKVPLPQLTDEKWDYTFDIDLKGIFRVVRPALPAMKAAKKGSVIAVSSIMGVAYGWDEHVHYSAAKAGVVGLVRGLAVELAREGIRVNGIAPATSAPRSCFRRSIRWGLTPTRPGSSFPWAASASPRTLRM